MVHKTQHHKIGEAALQTTLTRAKGRHQPYCVAEEPKRQYYISNLAPTHGTHTEDEFVSQIKPNAIALDFQPEESEYPLRIEFDVYYRSVPTYDEYEDLVSTSHRVADLSNADRANPEEDSDGTNGSADAEDEGTDGDSNDVYALDKDFYRRIDVRYEGSIDLSNPEKEADRITRELQTGLREAVRDAFNKHIATRDEPDPENWPSLDLTSLDKDDFERVVESFDRLDPSDVQWNVKFAIDDRSASEVSLSLRNAPVGAIPEEDEDGEIDHPADESHVFNPKIAIEGRATAYEFDLVPEDFRYDQSIWAKGRNCSTHVESIESTDKRRLETSAVPRAPVYEFEFNQDYETSFKALAGDESDWDTIEMLESIEDGMRQYLRDWRGPRKRAVKQDLTDGEIDEYEAAADDFEREIERFAHGIEVLDHEEDVLKSFQMMNLVNHRVHWEMKPGDEGFEGWRLFQLVFIVSNLSSVVARDPEYKDDYATDYDEMAEVLWFPTGGGKTEAYLGLILFNLFFDRLRGKAQGVTAWIRFPLRLLSRQQKTRFIRAMLVAETMRQDSKDDGGLDGMGEPFSLGHYVGSNDTPNAIGGRNNLDEAFAASQEALREEAQVLEECPLCESEVKVRYEADENTVYHDCTGDDCLGTLPLYVVDRDIYRHVPSVLLGSLDKIAVMGMQPRFANLLGNFTTHCPVHGYGYSDNCGEKGNCNHEIDDVEPGSRDEERRGGAFDPVPTLHLIDEVHLLNEELGSFASHYETLYLYLCRKLHGVEPKVITSTATIEKYERQIENLFQKDAVRFPESGPARGETFYGEFNFEKVEREYIGLTPNNRTHLYAVLDLIKLYHQVIRDYYDYDADGLAQEVGIDPKDFDANDQQDILDLYETSLVYFTNKREKDTYRKNIQKQINDEMVEDGYENLLRNEQLTADTESPDLLEELINPDADFQDRIDTVPATSFVGHGIDVPRFNMMTFFGYPSQTFQYIQASSRVGRQDDVPGFVLDVFRPFDKRDRHRYKYFEKLHEYLSRTVEPVPIDRWAKFAIERTFPGILMSIIRQYYRPMLYRDKDDITINDNTQPINTAIASHLYEVMNNDEEYPELTQDKLWEHLQGAYALDNGRYTNEYFEERVEERLQNIWQYWDRRLDTELDNPEFPGDERPMINLRDIGQGGHITAFNNEEEFIEVVTSN